ncbi:DoxX family protein [Amphritea atlantica]|uniref:DoxX family protein n=1 Tax=Amphritea atlantica TaxID=355243 RepID=A0ABY5GXJ0_9GAMM|nr:DoxX family protein [Amphritea atlantica]
MNLILNPAIGASILRASLGIVLMAHSLYLKMIVYTLAGTAQFFASIGLPEILAYIVFFVEAIAGVALVLGFKTRLFSALVIPILLGATWVHSTNGWLFSNTEGGWEYPLLLTIMAVAQFGVGDGKYSISAYFQSKKSPCNRLEIHS